MAISSGIVIGPCSLCKWWEINEPETTTLGSCLLTQWSKYTHENGGFEHPTSKAKAIVEGLISADAHDAAAAVLETSADFGCVQWERKS